MATLLLKVSWNSSKTRTQYGYFLGHPSCLVMGISRDNWHKRRATGGKRCPPHKKRKFELGRPASNTKVNYLILYVFFGLYI